MRLADGAPPLTPSCACRADARRAIRNQAFRRLAVPVDREKIMNPKLNITIRARIRDDLYARVAARAPGGNVSAAVVTALEVYDAVARVLEERRA